VKRWESGKRSSSSSSGIEEKREEEEEEEEYVRLRRKGLQKPTNQNSVSLICPKNAIR